MSEMLPIGSTALILAATPLAVDLRRQANIVLSQNGTSGSAWRLARLAKSFLAQLDALAALEDGAA